MCGITAYLGFRAALPILLKGLQRLEYRGYDSAGVAIVEKAASGDVSLYTCKRKGKVSVLCSAVDGYAGSGSCGIAHTRWATHGPPSDANSHPHLSAGGHIAVVHNGIIENFHELKKFLERQGITFRSETDTEVLAHLIELARQGTLTGETGGESHELPLEKAVAIALSQVDGTFGIAVVDSREPDVLVGARKGSPLIMGIGKDTEPGKEDGAEYFLASDASALVEHTSRVVYLEEGDIVRITRDGHSVYALADVLKLVNRIRSQHSHAHSGRATPVAGGGADEVGLPLLSAHERAGSFSELRRAALAMAVATGAIPDAEGDGAGTAGAGAGAAAESKADGSGAPPPRVPPASPLRRFVSEEVKRRVHTLEISLQEIEKGGYKHFMLKEIMDQPRTLQNCMRGRVSVQAEEDGSKRARVVLGGLQAHLSAESAGEALAGQLPEARLAAARRIIICACGTSWHAGLVGEYMLEHLAGVSVEVEYASEFIYRGPILYPDQDVVLVISQSGETADTLEAVRLAKRHGVLALGICNVVGSSIARETHAGVYLHAGPEIGVASTKAFTAQITVLAMIALRLGHLKGRIDDATMLQYAEAMLQLPGQLEATLPGLQDRIMPRSKEFRYATNFLYLGRGFNFPVALEGALKLKEISYIHAEGYPAAEMKHGPIALIDRFMPVVFIALKSDATYQKIQANVQEVMARGGTIVVITEEGNTDFDDTSDFVIKVPRTLEWLSPIVTVAPLQLLAYHVADCRGCNVDQPRNLAKSVTVE